MPQNVRFLIPTLPPNPKRSEEILTKKPTEKYIFGVVSGGEHSVLSFSIRLLLRTPF